ncbi:MAG TPA: Hpt domain-containing protein [Allocoleopsis sp.]
MNYFELDDESLSICLKEAQKNLQIIQLGILDLMFIVNDSERMIDILRSCYVIKSLAEVLDYEMLFKLISSINEGFLIIQNNPIITQVNEELKQLFWDVFVILKDVVNNLKISKIISNEEWEIKIKNLADYFWFEKMIKEEIKEEINENNPYTLLPTPYSLIKEINEHLREIENDIDGGKIAPNMEKFIGYFVEDAKEHLQILEKTILNLSKLLKDSDSIHEVYRSIFSLKGGSAMLGYDRLRKYVLEVEKCFKIIRDYPHFALDQRLKELLDNLYVKCQTELMKIEIS